MKKDVVVIKRKRNQIIITIKPEEKYDDVISILKKKLPALKKAYHETPLPIEITGRVFKKTQMDEIKDLIKEKTDENVDLEFDVPKLLGLHSIKRTFNKNLEISQSKFHRGSLRSGQRMETEGSLVIIGDVNAGAEVAATENIIVLGTLRGLAHAGAKGNKDAIIAAGNIDAVQIRIANIVKEINREEEPLHKQSCCFIENNLIVIE